VFTCLITLLLIACANVFGQTNPPPDVAKPHQTVSTNKPPTAPPKFNPDTGAPLPSPKQSPEELRYRRRYYLDRNAPEAPPQTFNPDPGGGKVTPQPEPFYKTNYGTIPEFQGPPVEKEMQLPRRNLERFDIAPREPEPAGNYGHDPVPDALKLPRAHTRLNERIPWKWEPPEYKGHDYPPNTEPMADRWKIPFAPWRRYVTGDAETPYLNAEPALWHPYRQSLLKGDLPVIGQDIFLDLTASTETLVEERTLPTPSGISSSQPISAEFFGNSEQTLVQQYFSFSAELFKGETVFQPPHWTLFVQPVYNFNYVDLHETTVVSPNPSRGTTRFTDYFSPFQQAFGELHLGDLSDNYDFFAFRLGNQPFNSDFRGFIFNDINSAARIFGNYANNLWQYNVIAFDMREKDTNSELNKPDERDQRILILNVYKQDFLTKGYTAEWSFHANIDQGRTHYDRNGNIARPTPIGTVVPHDINAFYVGWAGDGHIGRWNVNHAFYQAFGHDEFNGIAGQPVDINAQMAALELSYDRDWIRYKGSFFYASGDGNAEDSNANGFDGIVDNPHFSGGPFSWYARQGFNLAGTSVGLKQRNSLFPNLRTSKTEGQANFVNPGIFIYGLGAEIDVTPKLRNFWNFNYIRFAETDVLKTVLLTDKVGGEFGYDISTGFQYRPLLTDNVIISTGLGVLVPGRGYRDIYRSNSDPVPGFESGNGRVDTLLYSGILAVTLTY
jgi:hypothetical protein